MHTKWGRQTICCPITQMPMRHPVYVYPHHYELSALLDWFRKGHINSPLTREKVTYAVYDKTFKAELDALNPEDRYDDYDCRAAFKKLNSYLTHPYSAARQEMNKTGTLFFFTAAFFALLMKAMGGKNQQAPQADLADLLCCLFFVAGCRFLYRMVEPKAQRFFSPPNNPQRQTGPALSEAGEERLSIDH